MRQIIRLMLAIEAACFTVAGAIHSGLLVAVDIHHQAALAESVIGAGLLIGLALTWVWPNQTRLIGLIAQAFATLGTLIGVYTIIVGFGPRGAADLVFHIAILVVLGWGLVTTARFRSVRGARA
jgi:hypothetical protein